MTRPRFYSVLIVLLTLLAAGAAPVQAAPRGDAAGLGRIASKTITTAPHEILRYWTSDRMRSAKPATPRTAQPELLPGLFPGYLGNTSDSATDNGQTRKSAAATRWDGGGSFVSTVGKVYFTLKGVDYLCTATVLGGSNRDTLVTAGHCVNSGPGEFATNWVFVPAYNSGSEPYGRWTARALHTPTSWSQRGDLNHDVGFAVLASQDGRHIADVTGTQNIQFNPARGGYVHSFGYPALHPYQGHHLYYCQGNAQQDPHGGFGQGVDCDMTEGSSGGPWFAGFDGNNGTVISVNSFGYDDTPNVMWGPYLGDTAQATYGTAQAS